MVDEMTKFATFETQIRDRLKELDVRLNEIETELDQPKSRDLGEQAIDLEDDEVLESIGIAGQKEIALLRKALARIADETYGACLVCGESISEERLTAVPYAPLCKVCALESAKPIRHQG
jgi:DnaK suppressor protein